MVFVRMGGHVAGSSWPSLSAGQPARASDVESKFDWAEQDLVPHSAGNTTDGAYDLGTVTAQWRRLHVTQGINPTTSANPVTIGTTSSVNASSTAFEVAGTRAIMLPRLTTAQRDLLTPSNGHVIYNSTLNNFQVYENSSWRGMGSSYQTQYTTATFSIGGGGTATATLVSVAGPGRLISVRTETAVHSCASAVVYIDGVALISFATNTTASIGIGPDRTLAAVNTTTAAPYMGWGFESSLTVYGAGTTAASGVRTYVITFEN